MPVTEQYAPTAVSLARDGAPHRQAAREVGARTYAHALRSVPVRARGLTIEAADGRRCPDRLSGAGTPALGPQASVVSDAIHGVLEPGAPLPVLHLAEPVQGRVRREAFQYLARFRAAGRE